MADLITAGLESGQDVQVSNDRTFNIQGMHRPDPRTVGLGAHLVRPGTRRVIAVGRLAGYSQPALAAPYIWGVAFNLRHIAGTSNNRYDIIISTYRAKKSKTSQAVVDEIKVIQNVHLIPESTPAKRVAILGVRILIPEEIFAAGVGTPASGSHVSKSGFVSYGSWTNDDVPTYVKMVDKNGGTTTIPLGLANLMANGQSGSWNCWVSRSGNFDPALNDYTFSVVYSSGMTSSYPVIVE